jgi:hypothetical protein
MTPNRDRVPEGKVLKTYGYRMRLPENLEGQFKYLEIKKFNGDYLLLLLDGNIKEFTPGTYSAGKGTLHVTYFKREEVVALNRFEGCVEGFVPGWYMFAPGSAKGHVDWYTEPPWRGWHDSNARANENNWHRVSVTPVEDGS